MVDLIYFVHLWYDINPEAYRARSYTAEGLLVDYKSVCALFPVALKIQKIIERTEYYLPFFQKSCSNSYKIYSDYSAKLVWRH